MGVFGISHSVKRMKTRFLVEVQDQESKEAAMAIIVVI
jgi:hypothetical protein